FGDETQETVRRPVSRRLADLALRQPNPLHKLFALEVLHETASVDTDFDFLRGATGAADIFGLECAQPLSNERLHGDQIEQEASSAKEAVWNDSVALFSNHEARSSPGPHRVVESFRDFENRDRNGGQQFFPQEYAPKDARRTSALVAGAVESASVI